MTGGSERRKALVTFLQTDGQCLAVRRLAGPAGSPLEDFSQALVKRRDHFASFYSGSKQYNF